MVKTLEAYISQHATLAKSINPDAFTAYDASQAPVIWAEGGEWPAFKPFFVAAFNAPKLREMEVDFENPGAITHVKAYLKRKMAEASVIGLTFGCGIGKSTFIMQTLYDMKAGSRVVVVQPSIAVAMELSDYMTQTKGVSATCLTDHCALPKERALIYTNPGITLELLATRKLDKNDVIVIDEAHIPAFTNAVLIEALAQFTMPVLMMTASTTPTIRAQRGVKLVKVESTTPQVSNAIAQHSPKSLMVGVSAEMAYNSPAAIFVGATLDINVVYDPGVRPEPRVKSGELRPGERKATMSEILQMANRPGRLGRSGTVYYNDDASVLHTDGHLLYDIMLQAIRSVTGLSDKLPVAKAIQAWKKSGIVGSKPLPTPIVTQATPPLGADAESPMVTALAEQTCQLKRSASIHSVNSRTPSSSGKDKFGTPESRASSRGRRHDMLEPIRTRGSSVNSMDLREIEQTLPPYSPGKEVPRSRAGSVSSHGSHDSKTLYKFHHKRRSSSRSGEIVRSGALHVEATVRRGSGEIVAFEPDPMWRPFRRDYELNPGEYASETGIGSVIARIEKAFQRGDRIYPAKFPRVDASSVSFKDKMDARDVLADRVQPVYSESELMAVMVLWNEAVAICENGRCHLDPQTWIKYSAYFRGYQNFERYSI